ncbi:MAG: putative FAD-linked oxidoreductase [Steroidobacteraceae bacterium]|nr:putative FAD-linked oxidoreductase [Steroidobacteraceae bacterium]
MSAAVTDKVALAGFRRIVGPDAVLTAPDAMAPFLSDHRKLYEGAALAVLRPGSVEEVSQLLAFCNGTQIGVVPQGGNTGYCGGATPDESGRQVVLSLARLARLRSIDATNNSMVAEAGCLLANLQREAEAVDRYFPLSLGSEGSCQIGGNLGTNAGGLNVVRYGMTRDLVLGLEVVLADGRVLSSLGELRKDNTGYDLKALFVGAEGTLGVITAASLKLFPRPRAIATAFVAVRSVAAAVDLLNLLREASGDRVSSFELVPQVAIELTTRHISGVSQPLAGEYPWCVLCELTSARAADDLDAMLENALREAMDGGLLDDAALAQNERQRAAFWRLRESIPEAQRREGASLKHDIALPIGALARFVAEASGWIAAHLPEAVLVAYGHVGDGNLHFNVNARAGTDPLHLVSRADEVQRVVHDLVAANGGSISAEHGIGRLKVDELARYAPPVKLELMRAIKRALDPNGIMNPGKVLHSA